jgi:hypothetical protein
VTIEKGTTAERARKVGFDKGTRKPLVLEFERVERDGRVDRGKARAEESGEIKKRKRNLQCHFELSTQTADSVNRGCY